MEESAKGCDPALPSKAVFLVLAIAWAINGLRGES
jgi:hypothetical protein